MIAALTRSLFESRTSPSRPLTTPRSARSTLPAPKRVSAPVASTRSAPSSPELRSRLSPASTTWASSLRSTSVMARRTSLRTRLPTSAASCAALSPCPSARLPTLLAPRPRSRPSSTTSRRAGWAAPPTRLMVSFSSTTPRMMTRRECRTCPRKTSSLVSAARGERRLSLLSAPAQ